MVVSMMVRAKDNFTTRYIVEEAEVHVEKLPRPRCLVNTVGFLGRCGNLVIRHSW